MIIIFVILFILTTALSVYFGARMWYLAGALAEAQEYIEELQKYEEDLEVTNMYMYSKISESYDMMQRIDRLGAFEKDDESGTTFQLLSEVITELKEQFDGQEEEKK
jgi:hypothetical protein